MKRRQGQGMMEYIILVALVAIAAIGIMRVFGQTVSAKIAQITTTLQGRNAESIEMEDVEEKHWRKRGLDDFFKSSR